MLRVSQAWYCRNQSWWRRNGNGRHDKLTSITLFVLWKCMSWLFSLSWFSFYPLLNCRWRRTSSCDYVGVLFSFFFLFLLLVNIPNARSTLSRCSGPGGTLGAGGRQGACSHLDSFAHGCSRVPLLPCSESGQSGKKKSKETHSPL